MELINITMKAGERVEYEDKFGGQNFLILDKFPEHDHKTYPVYFLDYPLSEKDISLEKNKMVVTISGFGFTKPYCSTLEKTWKIESDLGVLLMEIIELDGEKLLRVNLNE